MALTIKENNGIFSVAGSINATTARQMKTHFKMVINVFSEIAINIEKITEIDTYGFDAIKTLHTDAVSSNTNFFMIGKDVHGIYERLTCNSDFATV
ncbi:STAS domain-containing protein [Winogradskyella sp. PE311]|uniref:STAS domain-containing protein n=1 Tax=Winogradskyella sp. PE311 TaxID=3366943 RepID=UPI003980C7CB